MADRPWKQFERLCASLIGGTRFWANSGEAVDVEGPTILGQCKQVKSLSLQALTKLVVVAEAQGAAKGKAGMVFVKHRGGAGKATLPLVVMSFDTYHGEKVIADQYTDALKSILHDFYARMVDTYDGAPDANNRMPFTGSDLDDIKKLLDL